MQSTFESYAVTQLEPYQPLLAPSLVYHRPHTYEVMEQYRRMIRPESGPFRRASNEFPSINTLLRIHSCDIADSDHDNGPTCTRDLLSEGAGLHQTYRVHIGQTTKVAHVSMACVARLSPSYFDGKRRRLVARRSCQSARDI